MEQTLVKPYFCTWLNPDTGKWEEEYFEEFLDAMDSAHSCDISQFRYHWGDTQGKE